jgi:hypothetical protein
MTKINDDRYLEEAEPMSVSQTADVEMLSATMDAAVAQHQRSNNPMSTTSRILMSDSLMEIEKANSQLLGNDDTGEYEQPQFNQVSVVQQRGSNKNAAEYRRVRCPTHRYTPLREHWEQILTPLVEYLKLQVSCDCGVSATNSPFIWNRV